MAITFRDAFNGMAQVVPQLMNQYFQYMQLQLDYQRTQAYTGYMETQSKVGEEEILNKQLDRRLMEERAPIEIDRLKADTRANDLLSEARQAEIDGLNMYEKGGAAGYSRDMAIKRMLQLSTEINDKIQSTATNKSQQDYYARQAITDQLTQTQMRLDMVAGTVAMVDNEEALTKIFDDLGKQHPTGYTFGDIASAMTANNIKFKSPASKEAALKMFGTFMEMESATINSREQAIDKMLNAANDPETGKAYRELLGIKKGADQTTLIGAVQLAYDARQKLLGNPVTRLGEIANAYKGANDFLRQINFTARPQDKEEPVVDVPTYEQRQPYINQFFTPDGSGGGIFGFGYSMANIAEEKTIMGIGAASRFAGRMIPQLTNAELGIKNFLTESASVSQRPAFGLGERAGSAARKLVDKYKTPYE